MNKLIRSTAIAFVLCSLLVSCGSAGNSDTGKMNDTSLETSSMEENIMLTDRQKSILKDEGLPTEYNELSDSQKHSIGAIEDMLVYLEDKYNETFIYTSYTPSGEGDPECITAYCNGDDSQEVIIASREYDGDNYIYSDNYLQVLLKDEYYAEICKYLDGTKVAGHYFGIVELSEIADGEGSVVSRAGSDSVIFIENVFADEEETKAFVNEYAEWIKTFNCNFPVGIKFFIQNQDDFSVTNEYTYSEQIHAQKFVSCYDCSISSNGNVDITRS